MNRIKEGDLVVIISGRDKGRQGKVLSIKKRSDSTTRAIVEGLNLVKKHVKPNPQKNEQGGILDREAPIQLSNLALVNPSTGKADKVMFKFLEDGKKVRCYRSNQEIIDV